MEKNSDAMLLIDAAGVVLYASPSSAIVFGYLPEELVGWNTLNLIHPKDQNRSRRALRAVLARPPSPRQIDVRVRRKDGSWCEVDSTIHNVLAVPQVGAIIVTCRETTARRALREQEQHQAEELMRSNKRLEDLAYAVAHDFREPLRTISTFTELLVRQSTLDAHGKQLAQFIGDGVKRMGVLFEDLNAAAIRGFDDPPQTLALSDLVAEVLQNLEHAITISNAIVTADPLPFVQGSRNSLLRIIQNLVVNAIKYRSEVPVTIHFSADHLGSDWIVRVKDNGIGIAPEHHDSVFRLLKRLHGPERPGTGIGLAVCKKLVEGMGGAIWVESGAGSGSTFCFTVAAVSQPQPGSAVETDTRYANGALAKRLEDLPIADVAVGAAMVRAARGQ